MNDSLWHAFIDTLSPDHRDIAQKIMARINTTLRSDRQRTFDEMQRGARKSDRNAARIDDLNVRLDIYEEQRAKDVQAELERFAREQLPPEERDRLIGVLYNVVARLEQIESGDDQQSET